MFTKSISGQGMNEYALIAGLVVIGSIATLGALGTTVSDLLGGTITNRKTVAQSTPAVNQPPTFAPSLVATPVSVPLFLDENAQSLAGAELEIRLPNGRLLNTTAPNFQNLPEPIGSDGVTNAYLAQLNQLIEALTLDNADPELVNNLKALASQGFYTADEQAKMELNMRGMRMVEDFTGKNASNNNFTVFTRQDMMDSFNQLKSKAMLLGGIQRAFDSKLNMALQSKQLQQNPALAKYIQYLGGNIQNAIKRSGSDVSRDMTQAREMANYATNYTALGVSLSALATRYQNDPKAIASFVTEKMKTKLPNLSLTPMEKTKPSAITEFNAQKICDQSGAIRCRAAAQ